MPEQVVTVNYREDLERCKRFLQDFRVGRERKYADLMRKVANRETKMLTVELDDVRDFFGPGEDDEFLRKIAGNTRRYSSLFAQAVEEELPAPTVPLLEQSVMDVLQHSRERMVREAAANEEGQGPVDPATVFPSDLKRNYEVYIVPESTSKEVNLRAVNSQHIGTLVKVKGIVTRVSEVKPLCVVAVYTCDSCGHEIYQEVTGSQFMPLHQCPSARCVENRTMGRLQLQTRGSKFVKFQSIKMQELSDQVPVGHIPRTMTVFARGEQTRHAQPGDLITVTGIFLPLPTTSHRQQKMGMTAETYLEAQRIEQHKKSYSEYTVSAEMARRVRRAASDGAMYDKLANSIAPEIYGLEDEKKALLLLMVGGVSRHVSDGMKIRGDINALMVGDPGVAKSQLLKYVAHLAPRGVYTTGKGSSGVGLTAAVLRDPITGEMALEGGALVLADMGIACIDEFDKMEDHDRTAIHEVMEQQTISIAKGGIQTTLNARTSILAAANPAYGRYNIRRSPSENINLPPALVSRFDMLFVMRDKADHNADKALARHITWVHAHSTHPPLDFEPVDSEFIRAYLAKARQHDPIVPRALTDIIAAQYVEMRRVSEIADAEGRSHGYTSARTLLAILRLSTALARLRFADEVSEADVHEACRLMEKSKGTLDDDEEPGRRTGGFDRNAALFSVIQQMFEQGEGAERIPYAEVRRVALARGLSDEQILAGIDEYDKLDFFHLSADQSEIIIDDDGALRRR